MEKYDVSYSQVYAWVRKYKSGGEEALKDDTWSVTSLRKSWMIIVLSSFGSRIRSTERVFRNGRTLWQKSWQRSGDDTYTLTLVRHADWYQAIQELHTTEEGYAVTARTNNRVARSAYYK
ncbi:helix-turn-helix domain-containing protein [Paenibacillus larvae]|nr:helix-turn-helix domain-containing protein [Paenibacillus larvae]MDT2247401.1 helix-turn-helix domain-containing protein [Paenibacillus larvae]